MTRQQRRQTRRHLVYYLKVVDPAANEQVIGHVVDITTIGMMMISKQPLEPGCEIDLRIQVPEDLNSTGCIELRGVTVWCHKDVNPDYYAAGFEFRSLSPEALFTIKDLIDALGFHD